MEAGQTSFLAVKSCGHWKVTLEMEKTSAFLTALRELLEGNGIARLCRVGNARRRDWKFFTP